MLERGDELSLSTYNGRNSVPVGTIPSRDVVTLQLGSLKGGKTICGGAQASLNFGASLSTVCLVVRVVA